MRPTDARNKRRCRQETLLRTDLLKNKGSLTINDTSSAAAVTHGENRELAKRETLRSTAKRSLLYKRTDESVTDAETVEYLTSITDTATASKAGTR